MFARFQGFWRLMVVWKGSVAKLIWHDLIMFLFLYYVLSFLYRFWLIQNEVYREYFEIICIYCSRFQCLIPVEFLTGFYVTQVVTRYWDQFMSLQWPDGLALKLVSFVPGQVSNTTSCSIFKRIHSWYNVLTPEEFLR